MRGRTTSPRWKMPHPRSKLSVLQTITSLTHTKRCFGIVLPGALPMFGLSFRISRSGSIWPREQGS